MKRILAVLLLSVASIVFAQQQDNLAPATAKINGEIYANAYGTWSVPAGNSGMMSWSSASICTVNAGGTGFPAFTVGTPIRIVDIDPQHSETVTVTNVDVTPTACAITTTTPVYPHQTYSLESATGGLQEAINANLHPLTPSAIRLTSAWYANGGTHAIIGSVTGNSSLALVDATTSPYTWYAWNGSHYTAIALGTVTVGSGAPANPCTAVGAQYLDQQAKNYYVCAASGSSWIGVTSSAPLGNQRQVLGVPLFGGDNVPVQSLTLTTMFLPTVAPNVTALIPTVPAALSHFDIPQDNGNDGQWQDSSVGVIPTNASPAAAQAAISNGGTKILPSSSTYQAWRYPFTVPANTIVQDNRGDEYAHPVSVTQIGAACNASYQTSSTVNTVAGSNQVAVTNAGGYAKPILQGETLIVVGTVNGLPTAWEPIVTAYNSTTSTITTFDNAPFSSTNAQMIYGFDDTQAIQASYGAMARPHLVVPSFAACLTHTLHGTYSNQIAGVDKATSELVGFPGEDVIDTTSSYNAPADIQNLTIYVNNSIDATKPWQQIVTYPSSTCSAVTTSGCISQTIEHTPTERHFGRMSIYANFPLGQAWCQKTGQGECSNAVATVEQGSATITVATGETAPAQGDTVVFPYLSPAFEATVTAVSGQTVTLSTAYPGASGTQVEFFDGNTFQTLAAAMATSDTTATLTLPLAWSSRSMLDSAGSDGMVRIDNELISYHLVNRGANQILNLTRGVDGTTAAAHSSGALVTPVNPFDPTRPFPVNPTLNSNGQATPVGAEYYPAFDAGNAAIVWDGQQHEVIRDVEIQGTQYDTNKNSTVGLLEAGPNIPYYPWINGLQVNGLGLGWIQTLPYENGPLGNSAPDMGGSYKNIKLTASQVGAFLEFGSITRWDDLEIYADGAGVIPITWNCEAFDSTQIGWQNGTPNEVCPSGAFDSAFVENSPNTDPSLQEPLEIAGPTSISNYAVLWSTQTIASLGATPTQVGAVITNSSFGDSDDAPSFPFVLYGNHNIIHAQVAPPLVAGSVLDYGLDNSIATKFNAPYAPLTGVADSGIIPQPMNIQNADTLLYGNMTPDTWFANGNSGVIYPYEFPDGSHQQSATVFVGAVPDDTAIGGSYVSCASSMTSCTGVDFADGEASGYGGYQIRPKGILTPQTYTLYFQYKVASGTGTFTANALASTTNMTGTTGAPVVITIASQIESATTSWQTAEIDNITLGSYPNQYFGFSVTGMSSGTYQIGTLWLVPVAQKIIANKVQAAAIQDTGVTGSTQCLQVDTNGNVTGSGSACGTQNSVLPTPPSSAAHYTNLEVPGQFPGATWQSCTTSGCSGGTGTGTGTIATGVNVPGFSSTAMLQQVQGSGTNILAWLKASASSSPVGGSSTTGTLTLTVQAPIMGNGSIEIKASASDTTYAVTAIQIYVDGTPTPVFNSGNTPPITPIDYTITGMTAGYHNIVVKAWDNSVPGTQTSLQIPASFGPVINNLTNVMFSTDFWIPAGSSTLQALEFDPDLYDGSYEYFLSVQCDSVSGQWREWNMAAGAWVTPTENRPCTLLNQDNQKHSLTIYGTYNQSNQTYTYQTLVVDGSVVFQNANETYDAKALTATPSLIVEHQIDNNSSTSANNTIYYANTQLWTWGPQSGGGGGAGTVTNVSGTTSGGFTVSTTNPTTTPAVSVAADSSHYLPTTTDEANWNAKQAALTFPLSLAQGGTGTATPGLVAGTNVTITGTWPDQTISSSGGGSGMVYPGAGVPSSTGSAWGTSYSVGTAANDLLQLNSSGALPAVSAANLTNFPTLNQSTTGNAATATALAAAPTTCSAGQAAAGILASGNATGCFTPSGSGTVTSVGLTMPSIFSVAGSPVTGSGTLAATLATESANAVFAGPSSGAAAIPTFRPLVAADIPSLPYLPTSGGTLTGSLTISRATPGSISVAAGTGNIPALSANSAGFAAPATGGTSYLYKLPATAAAGLLYAAAPATADGVNESALSSLSLPSCAAGQFLSYSGTAFSCATPSGGGSGTIGGSIAAGQIAIGAATANAISGSSALTYSSTNYSLYLGGTTEPYGLVIQSNNTGNDGVSVYPNFGVEDGSSWGFRIVHSSSTNGFLTIVGGTPMISGSIAGTNSGGTAPTIAAGAGAGTSPTVSVANADSTFGYVSVTTGTAPTASATVATITIGANSNGGIGTCILTPANAITAALTGSSQVYVPEAAATGAYDASWTWTIVSGSTALAASSTYLWRYMCGMIQ